ncbi:unnamed protein product [Amoebophrya sp. A25]|nr:unnamed protein product [Amoebophrya sp. A25]|eukprot:GSA25T00024523001.1
MSRQMDRQITVFSPEGKLYQIEYALKSIQNAGILGVCLRGGDAVCMVAQRKVSEKLMDPSYVTNMYVITPNIGALCIGSNPDCKDVILEARQIAGKFKDQNGYEIPVHFLAAKIGKKAQIFTQNAGMRPLGAVIHLCAVDDEKGPQLWKIDPSGHYFGWKALATGPKDQEANNMLEKVVKQTDGNGERTLTIRKTLDVLMQTLAQDVKPTDVEVGVVTAEGGFRMLSVQEIDDHLTAIHEQD